jgi:hypothetical protein
MSDPITDILVKRKEAQMLADVLPESLERFQLQQRIWACDHALDFLKGGERNCDESVRPKGVRHD